MWLAVDAPLVSQCVNAAMRLGNGSYCAEQYSTCLFLAEDQNSCRRAELPKIDPELIAVGGQVSVVGNLDR